MVADGASRAHANGQVWLIDQQGLLTDEMSELRDYQKPYARSTAEVVGWADGGPIDLLTTVRHVKPTILLGTSTVPGAFTEEIIRSMAEGVVRPIAFPNSNPTERIEVQRHGGSFLRHLPCGLWRRPGRTRQQEKEL